jgi:glycosyltransferase involved in cell wall biosynthesis
MPVHAQKLLREAYIDRDGPLNILTFPTHERYETNLCKTGHNFYAWRAPGIKDWNTSYAPLPDNYTLLNPNRQAAQLPLHIDIDLVLSQNKFGQFQIAGQLAPQLAAPLVSIEHTLPMKDWPKGRVYNMKQLKGHQNLFISEFSRREWGWSEDEADVIHHGIDTDMFKPDDVERDSAVLSVVNDWINRDWCCGFNLWCQITGYPNPTMPIKVLGSTPGLSEPASSTEDLVKTYQSTSIYLNTSLISPVPTAMLEAMACGCAVVTTETCMIPEIIKNGENGFISNDPKKLQEYVLMLLSDKSLAKKLGDNARRTVIEKFSLDCFVNNWNKVFEKALGYVTT